MAVWQRRSPDYDNCLCYRHDRRGSRLHVCNARRAVPAVQRLQAHPADHSIPRLYPAARSHRAAGCVLPEKRRLGDRYPRYSRVAVHRHHGAAAHLEA